MGASCDFWRVCILYCDCTGCSWEYHTFDQDPRRKYLFLSAPPRLVRYRAISVHSSLLWAGSRRGCCRAWNALCIAHSVLGFLGGGCAGQTSLSHTLYGIEGSHHLDFRMPVRPCRVHVTSDPAGPDPPARETRFASGLGLSMQWAAGGGVRAGHGEGAKLPRVGLPPGSSNESNQSTRYRTRLKGAVSAVGLPSIFGLCIVCVCFQRAIRREQSWRRALAEKSRMASGDAMDVKQQQVPRGA